MLSCQYPVPALNDSVVVRVVRVVPRSARAAALSGRMGL